MTIGSSLPTWVRGAYATVLSVAFLREAFTVSPVRFGDYGMLAPALASLVIFLIWGVVVSEPWRARPRIPAATAWLLHRGELWSDSDASVMRYVPRGTYISPFPTRGRPRCSGR